MQRETIRLLRRNSEQNIKSKYCEYIKNSNNIPEIGPKIPQKSPRENTTYHALFMLGMSK